MPLFATRHTDCTPNRSRSRSTTGSSAVTSTVLPGQISVHSGRPSLSSTSPTISWRHCDRKSFDWLRRPSIAPPAPCK